LRAAASARPASRLVSTILSPRLAKASATAKPMPPDPPNTTLVLRSLMFHPLVAPDLDGRTRRRHGAPAFSHFAFRRRFG
jgi:hypothetical protein